MIITIRNKTYGLKNIFIDYKDYFNFELYEHKINIEYNKSKKDFYAYVMYNKKKIRLHRLITNAPKGLVVDHINGNTLDNRRENLRVCTQKENTQNRKDTLEFEPTARNKTGVRGLFKLYSKRDNRYFYCVKLKGYKTKNFSESRYDEAVEYAKHPELMEELNK